MEIRVIRMEGDKFAKDGDKKVYKLVLLIKGVTPQFVNALKRAIKEYVKTLAIEDVYVYENNSAMWDEFIAHRLGLLPLNTPDIKEGEKVKGVLKKEGRCYVYAKDIKFERDDVYCPYEDIIVAYLEEGQRINMEVEAVLGCGKEHAKWAPAHVYYYQTADIVLEGELNEEEKKRLEELGALKDGKIEIPEEKKYDRTFIDAVESAAKGKIKVIPKDEYIFVIESYGQLDARKILELAIYELKKMAAELMNKLL